MQRMALRTRARDEAVRAWHRTERELADALRAARRVAGLTQAQLAAAIGESQPEISRRENARSTAMTPAELALHAAAIGLKLSVKLWPAGGALRDAAQARYIGAFLERVGHAWQVTLEAVVPRPGDLRAADILLTNGPLRIVVEVITRLTDLQAQVRAAQAKARDLEATRLVIVVAATHANRAALEEARPALADAFNLDSRRLLADLAASQDPRRDGILLLRA